MLKTNSKQAKENIKAYILEHTTQPSKLGYDYEDFNPTDMKEVSSYIMYAFYQEKVRHEKRNISTQELFIDWCQGLPSVLDAGYYYNVCAVDLLGDILEESEEEKARYTEAQAEETLTKLIYRELNNNR